jgi:4-hydroxybenzoate polyprenyltransferase
MRSNITKLLKVSRFRFWHYLYGPFFIGFAFTISDISEFFSPIFWIFLFLFTFPANFIIYSINDYFDRDTDRFNEKKKDYEIVYDEEDEFEYRTVFLFNILLFTLVTFFVDFKVYITVAIFLSLGIFYSAPPFRFKAKPFIDFLSNILYIIPAFVGYFLGGGAFINWYLVLSAFLWAWGMHLFSAIPDFEPDKKAELKNTIVFLGSFKSKILVMIFWSLIPILLWLGNFSFLVILPSLVYPIIMNYVIFYKRDVFNIYRMFPFINFIIGFSYFLLVLIKF